jgi:AcrR family transcriptional regulator
LAKEAGVSQGLPYRYFRSKDQLFRAFLLDALRSAAEPNPPTDAADESPLERIERLVAGLIERRRHNPEFFRYVHALAADRTLTPELSRLMVQRYERLLSHLRTLIAEAQAAGEVPGDDPDQLASALLGCLDGISHGMLRTQGRRVHFQVPDATIVLRVLGVNRHRRGRVRAAKPTALARGHLAPA